eukprot:8777480-Pyramimonas_sp.AAC.1
MPHPACIWCHGQQLPNSVAGAGQDVVQVVEVRSGVRHADKPYICPASLTQSLQLIQSRRTVCTACQHGERCSALRRPVQHLGRHQLQYLAAVGHGTKYTAAPVYSVARCALGEEALASAPGHDSRRLNIHTITVNIHTIALKGRVG